MDFSRAITQIFTVMIILIIGTAIIFYYFLKMNVFLFSYMIIVSRNYNFSYQLYY